MKPAIRLRGWLRRLPWDIVLVYLVFNALVGSLASIAMGRISSDFRNRGYDELNTIAALKSRQIGDWLQGLLREAAGATSPERGGTQLREVLDNPGDAAAQAVFRAFARSFDPVRRFAAVILMDQRGRLVASMPEQLPLSFVVLQPHARDLLLVRGPSVSDLFREANRRVYLLVVSPIAGRGALVLVIDAQRELLPLLREWPNTSQTAEAELVRRERNRALFLNELRFHENSGLTLSVPLSDPRRPAAAALHRGSGMMEGLDYRDVQVLAAWRAVPGSVWCIVVKEDLAEVEKPVRELGHVSLLLGIALGLTSTLLLVLRLRQLAGRTRAEHEALATHYGYLARYANDIILLLDGKKNIVEANDRAVESYGYDRSELLALRYDQLTDAGFDSPARREAGKGIVVESRHRRKDGSEFPAEASIRSVQVEKQRYTQCIVRDISERKKAEEDRRRLAEQVAQLRKQEAIGQLAAGVAHDVNNALTAIMGHGEYVRTRLADGESEQRSVEKILAAAKRASRVTHSLLVFSEQQHLAWKSMDLNAEIVAGQESLQRSLGDGVQLRLRLAPEPLVIRGDGDLIRLALTHLADNARQAMPRGGLFTLETTGADPDGSAAGTAFAHLRVSDTGTGMSKEVRERLFEPFFTTQGFGKGAGMGLAMVQGIVRQHGGTIEVSSAPGQGTDFRIFFPLTRMSAAEQNRPAGTEGG